MRAVNAHQRWRPGSAVRLAVLACGLLVALASAAETLLQGMQAYEAGDYARAYTLWQPAAQQGQPVAQYMLGVLYERGQGVSADADAAISWYRRAAEQGSPEAAYGLGRTYEARWLPRRKTGGGDALVDLDRKQALYWYRQAQKLGDTRAAGAVIRLSLADGQARQSRYSGVLVVLAMVLLAIVFIVLALRLMRSRRSPAVPLRERDDDERHFDAVYADALRGDTTAQYQLGLLYIAGQGAMPDAEAGVQWLRKAADRGNVDAQRELGCCYLQGSGVTRDLGLALMWLKRAAEADDHAAQREMGMLYLRGEGIAQDFQQVSYWLHKAAAGGELQAQYQLGLLFRDGAGSGISAGDGLAAYRPEEGMVRDAAAAMRWLKLAAEQGYADAQANLGDMCLKGEGITADREAALQWYRLAAGNGSDYAIMKLRRLLAD